MICVKILSMTERADRDRQKLGEEYRVVFEHLPQLKWLALSYWQQTERLFPGPDAIEEEKNIFHETIFEMANILLDDQQFQIAMEKEGVNAVENAIIESILMVETVLDIKESNNNNQ